VSIACRSVPRLRVGPQRFLLAANRNGGLILTHDELENGDLIPTWTSVDAGSVYTLKESFNRLQDEGWTVLYYRTPISADRPIEVRKGMVETRSMAGRDRLPFRSRRIITSMHTSLCFKKSILSTRAWSSTTVSGRLERLMR